MAKKKINAPVNDKKLRYLNSNFPCDKRKGLAKIGCCNMPKNLSPFMMNCDLHKRPMMWDECTDCPYQERVGRQKVLDQKKKK